MIVTDETEPKKFCGSIKEENLAFNLSSNIEDQKIAQKNQEIGQKIDVSELNLKLSSKNEDNKELCDMDQNLNLVSEAGIEQNLYEFADEIISNKEIQGEIAVKRFVTLQYCFDCFVKSNQIFLLYSLYYAEACNELTGPISASLRPDNTAPFEEISQRWRAVGNTASDLTGPRFEPQTSRSRDESVTARPTGRLIVM